MTAPHCTNVNHNKITCMAAGLQPEDFCEACFNFFFEDNNEEEDASATAEYFEDYE